MFTEQMQQDVIMVLKFPSNSPVTHVAANTQLGLTSPAIITVTANRLFAVNKWHGLTGVSMHYIYIYLYMNSLCCLKGAFNKKSLFCDFTPLWLCTNEIQGYFQQVKLLPWNHFFIFPRFTSFFHTWSLIYPSHELTRLISIGWTLIWETGDCVCWIAVSNVTHAAAGVRSHVHLYTSASHFIRPYLLNVHPGPGRNIKFDIFEFIRMKTDRFNLIHVHHRPGWLT